MSSRLHQQSNGRIGDQRKKRCAVIGAGGSGLPSTRWALAYDYEPVVFEASEQVGGMWYYREDKDTEFACVMKTTVINTSKDMSCYSDFPPTAESPNFMHNRYLHNYFKAYAEHHNLYRYIKFNHRVVQVRRADDFNTSGRWIIEYTDQDGKSHTEVFDAVLVCNGHHAKPQYPAPWPGQENYKGRVLHSHDYRDSLTGFQDSITVVVGVGNSGMDVAVEQSRISKMTYLSTRRGAWVVQKLANKGMPFDLQLNRRLTNYAKALLPHSVLVSIVHGMMNGRFDHEAFGIKPDHHALQQHPTINEEFPNRIVTGTLAIRPNIKRFVGDYGIEWTDGSVTEHVDNVVLATGYLFGYPILEKGTLIPVRDNEVPTLYKYMWPADLSHHTLAVIGTIQPVGSIMPLAEMQARVFFGVLGGHATLPSSEKMIQEMREKREANAKRYVKSLRHTIQVDYVEFMDELGDMIGCTARPWRLFFKSPSLAWYSIFGAVTGSQYRIFGPHPWEGAIEAALDTHRRYLVGSGFKALKNEHDVDYNNIKKHV